MCLIIAAWKSHPRYPLIVAANRDEFYRRPSIAAHFWKEAPQILSGRDLEKGGTWFGVNRSGHFAAVTNFRGGALDRSGRSRGELVARYLHSGQPCEDFLRDIDRDRSRYNPFNLLIYDGDNLAYTSETHASFELLTPGIHVIGNDRLNSPEKKIDVARAAMAKCLKKDPDEHALLELLSDTTPHANGDDPLAAALSAFFIRAPERAYGTRASSLYRVDDSGQALFCEQQFNEHGPLGQVKRFELTPTPTLNPEP